MEEVSNAKELLEETVSILNERKVASKALAEVDKRVLQATNGDKAHWKLLTKIYANKGKAWAGESPLVIDKEEKHKDVISPIFIKLLDTIRATEAFNVTDTVLGEYLEALAAQGIEIKINSDMFDHLDTDAMDATVDDELDSAKAYLRTMSEFSDEIRDEHTARAEELNFVPASSYMRIVNIYRKGVNGKEIDDDVQNILTYNATVDQAVNLAADYAKAIDARRS